MVTTTTVADVNELSTGNATPSFAEMVDANNATASLLLAKEALITAIQDRKLHRGHLSVLAEVAAAMSNRTAKAWPGRAHIAAKTGFTVNMVSKYLLDLRRFGHLLMSKEEVEEAGNRRLSVYTWGKIDHETLQRQITEVIMQMRANGVAERLPPEGTPAGKVPSQRNSAEARSSLPEEPLGGKFPPAGTPASEKFPQEGDSNNKNIIPPAGEGADPTPSRKREGKPRVKLPENWKPSAATVAWARENFVASDHQIAIEAQKFRDHHVSKGSKMADWPAAWRTWWGNGFHRIPRRLGSVAPLLDAGANATNERELQEMFERARLADEEEARCRR